MATPAVAAVRQPSSGLLRILGYAASEPVHRSQFRLGLRVVLLRGQPQPAGGGLRILFDAPAEPRHHPHSILRFGVARVRPRCVQCRGGGVVFALVGGQRRIRRCLRKARRHCQAEHAVAPGTSNRACGARRQHLRSPCVSSSRPSSSISLLPLPSCSRLPKPPVRGTSKPRWKPAGACSSMHDCRSRPVRRAHPATIRRARSRATTVPAGRRRAAVGRERSASAMCRP